MFIFLLRYIAEISEIVTQVLEGNSDTNKKDLNDREKDILKKRFPVKGKGLSLDELGLLHGISRERVRQIESNAIDKIVEINQSLFNTFNEELSKLISYYGSIIPIKSNEATIYQGIILAILNSLPERSFDIDFKII